MKLKMVMEVCGCGNESVKNEKNQPYTWSFFALACIVISTIMAIMKARRNGEKYVNGFYPILDLSKVIPLAIFFTFCCLTILLGNFGNTAFIYGQF